MSIAIPYLFIIPLEFYDMIIWVGFVKMGLVFKKIFPIYSRVMEDNKIKCAKCFKEMEEGKYKTCDRCKRIYETKSSEEQRKI